MRKLLLTLISLVTILFYYQEVKATHYSGGDITFECVGQDSFIVRFNFFRDCSGVIAPASANMVFTSSCGSFNQSLPMISVTEVSQLCPAEMPNSTCNGGWLNGVEHYIYEALIIFPMPCSDWNMGYGTCCHNNTVNLVGGPPQWADADMNSVAAPCNNSPIFTAPPLRYSCINQPVSYNYGIVEPDGDSLYFIMECVRSGQNSCVTYVPPYTASIPIMNNFTIDNNTGQVSFVPNTVGLFATVLRCEEYDRATQQLISVTRREVQFLIGNCTNLIPCDTAGYIEDFYCQSGTQTGPYSIKLCETDSVYFKICVCDPNVGDIVTLTSNISQAMQGAIFTPVPGNPACATISWVVPQNQPAFSTFYIDAEDDACPIPGIQSFTYNIEILRPTYTGSDTSVCWGDSLDLIAPGGVSYLWSTGSVNDSITVGPLVNTTYYVTVYDGYGCTDVDSVNVFILGPPLADAGTDQAICIFDSTQLNATGGVSYLWSPVTGLSNPNIPNPWASPTITTTYYVNVTDTIGCSKFDSVTVIVNLPPIIDAGTAVTICGADSVLIGGAPTGPAGSGYNWFPNTNMDDSTLANPTVWPFVDTTYYVIVTDTNGCVNIDSVLVSLFPATPADAGVDDTICLNDSVQLGATGGTGYLWTPVTGLSNPNIANPVASPDTTTIYLVIVIDSNGCNAVDTVIVEVQPLPPADAGQDDWICPGDSAQLNATGGVIYVWSPGTGLSNVNISNPKASPLDTTTYYVVVTDANGCVNVDTITIDVGSDVPTDAGPDVSICPDDSVQIGGNPTSPNSTTYTWTPTTGLDNPNSPNPLASPDSTTTYYIASFNDTCFGYDTVVVIVFAVPVADAGPDTAMCINDSTQLNANGGTSYVWSPAGTLNDDTVNNPWANPTSTTVYLVTVTDTNGCTNTDSVLVIVNPLPIVSTSPDTAVCFGDSTQLDATGGTIYLWSPGGTLNNDTINNPWANPDSSTTYTIQVIDSNGCLNTNQITVGIYSLPPAEAGLDDQICLRDSTRLNASGGVSYIWNPDISLSDTSIYNPWASPTVDNTYFITVTDANGCSKIDSVMVTVNSLPAVGFNITFIPCCEGLRGEFENTSPDAVSFLWDLDGTTSEEENPMHLFGYNNQLQVILTATNAAGCSDTSVYVGNADSLDAYFHALVPNVFSPNGDGINDWFEVEVDMEVYECTDLKIYNRWGKLMFSSSGNNSSWDGHNFAGKEVPEGVYFYILGVAGHNFNGTVTLIR